MSADDLLDNTMLPPTSSSPSGPITSPTVSALQYRQRAKAARPLKTVADMTPEDAPHDDFDPQARVTSVVPRDAVQRISEARLPAGSPPVVQGITLVPATALPDQLRAVFKFDIFNAVQSKCFASAFETDDNLVVSAPTGSGKTVIMEFAICRLVAECKGQDFKVIYQAPTKSLCAERYNDWQKKFGVLNLDCAELTGDTDLAHLRDVQKASIIITTPEKWDSITRKWQDHARLMQLVRLFLVDEVHILKDERGATLEAVVSRMKSVASSIRFVALSATVPNSEDIAIWLGKNSTMQHLPARREVFGENFRPVQLRKHVYGFETRSNDFAFESMLTEQIPKIIANHGRGKPVMVFCSTRRASVNTAESLADKWSSSHPMRRLWKGPDRQLSLANAELRATAEAGVAFHHGGLSVADRRTIEEAFLNGQINIICSTSTLAVGVNLPCYLVILKGTCAWTDSGLKEYADLEVMQMLGRAGRPQFESSSCAVILCRQEKVSRYEKMVSGEELLESCLHQNLIEHLNAEIVLGTVRDVATAKQWLASTFLYVRLRKNPSHYQFREGVDDSTDDEILEQLCKKDIDLLVGAGIVEEKERLTPTMFGEAMARYCVNFDTMKSFIKLPPKAKTSELLLLLAQAREFRGLRMQAGEKSFYKEINKAPEIKFPIKVDVALPSHKISLVMQAEMGSVALPDGESHKKHLSQYRIDRSNIFAHANRLIRCLIDCQIQLQDAISARNALELGRSLAAHVWDNTASQLRQVEGLGEVAVRKLAASSIYSMDSLLNTEPARIELVLGKNPPFGHQLLKKLESFPNLRVSVKETGRNIRHGQGATVKIVAEIGFLNPVPPQIFNKKPFSVCFLAEDSNGTLLEFRRFRPKKLEHGELVQLNLRLTKPTNHVSCYVMCDNVAGTSKYAELNLLDIPVSAYPKQPHQNDSTDGTNDSTDGTNDSTDGTKTVVRQAPVSSCCVDEFDDGGIEDQDLLAIDATGSRIEVIEDIDAILETDNRKSKSTEHYHNEDADASVYREPSQLPNGRWTCQHDCNERDKNCKHKCCKEGVAKPKRRSKAETKVREEEKGQKKITFLAPMQPKLRPGQKPQSKPNSKAPAKPRGDTTREMKDKNQRKKIKSAVEAYHERHKTSSSGDATFQKQSDEPAAKRAKRSQDHIEEFGGAEPDLDFESELKLDCSKDHAKQVSPENPEKQAATVEEGKDDLFLSFDEDDLLDFSFVESGQSLDVLSASEAAPIVVDKLNTANPGVCKEVTMPDNDDIDFLASDLDFGGLDPPLEHVTMSDVLKNDRTASRGQSSTMVQSIECFKDGMDSIEDFSGTQGEVAGLSTTPEKQLDDTFGTCPPDPSFTPGGDTPAESSIKTPGDMVMASKAEAEILEKETDAERDKRLFDEEQKKKWEGIDQWLYDEFHEYVELV
ncbi:hypothetical protein A1O7_09925 [Cladophialophora yegresii CBS 114405]|uniref:DNA 3'-5' helicase n=1 Tax=Cladophialophora yegresii CBS 114405 TaxID=1182544 RepID=W9W7Q6_9EURO|nr:uncharacterized protein A1O7_09925 [Cladophialophora yegresii CBS 114405]EXJ54584.1 hypothetical protein A1O7_09925 [Cladophialophora yegresii CBS 114405]